MNRAPYVEKAGKSGALEWYNPDKEFVWTPPDHARHNAKPVAISSHRSSRSNRQPNNVFALESWAEKHKEIKQRSERRQQRLADRENMQRKREALNRKRAATRRKAVRSKTPGDGLGIKQRRLLKFLSEQQYPLTVSEIAKTLSTRHDCTYKGLLALKEKRLIKSVQYSPQSMGWALPSVIKNPRPGGQPKLNQYRRHASNMRFLSALIELGDLTARMMLKQTGIDATHARNKLADMEAEGLAEVVAKHRKSLVYRITEKGHEYVRNYST